jgi:hypothetical protein
MVSFLLHRRSSTRVDNSTGAADDEMQSSSSHGSLADVSLEPAGPATPAAQEGDLPPPGKKYWPTQKEVDAVLAQLGEEDRRLCDAAMASRQAAAGAHPTLHALLRRDGTRTPPIRLGSDLNPYPHGAPPPSAPAGTCAPLAEMPSTL